MNEREEQIEDEQSDDELEPTAQVLALTAAYYGATYYCKEDCHTSSLTGAGWVAELEEGHPLRIFRNFRVTKEVFERLCTEVEEAVPASPWARVEVKESVAMFLYCLSKNASNRDLMERFQHSGETVHRHFHSVLKVVCSLAKKYIVQPKTPSNELAKNPKYASQFDKCRLAFDGTHIPAYVPEKDAKPFRDRTGRLSQNVFAACTFDMQFAFVLAGWEGSAADSTVLEDARRKGFATPSELFDLGDAGYGLTTEVLTPYRCVRYHLREWGQANERPQNYKEYYNLRHAQARNVIERAFGVVKRRFPVLTTPPEFSITTQAEIVLACCVLHNFIRIQNDPNDDPEGEVYGPDDLQDNSTSSGITDTNAGTTAQQRRAKTKEANSFRDRIAKAMWDSYTNYASDLT
ncbi:DDE superfamily endonuclease [Phytophthora infestans]|uniref:DDE superfamily endonuclease n=1 Tax=Phytophthora infestans TaxID=4787 RepID=A0A8S9U7H9_PHYIN|nr:DDE superfamily endonuclease [Phytophthora infestans]